MAYNVYGYEESVDDNGNFKMTYTPGASYAEQQDPMAKPKFTDYDDSDDYAKAMRVYNDPEQRKYRIMQKKAYEQQKAREAEIEKDLEWEKKWDANGGWGGFFKDLLGINNKGKGSKSSSTSKKSTSATKKSSSSGSASRAKKKK